MSQKPILEKKNNLVFILEVLLVSPSKMPRARNHKISPKIIRLLKKEKENIKLPTYSVEKEWYGFELLRRKKNLYNVDH